MTQAFAGFPDDFFAFFVELKANNERAWFEANKDRFRASVQAPLSAFVAAIAPRLEAISPHFTADPRPNGRSIFRIYRDVRFSKDKRPYKEAAACQFPHAWGRQAPAPSFYVHIAPGEAFYGGGLYMPAAPALARAREAIAERPEAWRAVKAASAFRRAFDGVEGEQLKRAPQGFDPGHPLIEDLKRKGFYAIRRGDEAAARTPGFVDEVADAFAAAGPLVAFLCQALDAPC